MENMKEVQAIQSLDEMTVILKNELDNIVDGFIAVGYYLKKVRDDELYTQKGYASIYEYAEKTFGIKRTTAVRFMEINDTYSIGGYSPEIEEKYRGYGSSKLTEMLQLPEDIREAVTKEATVAEIREAKKIVKETESRYDAQYELCDIAQNQEQETDWMKELVLYFFRNEGRERFKEFVLWVKQDVGNNEDDIKQDILELINPSKFRLVRLDTANVMMHANGIKVMPYRDHGETEEHSYIEFAQAFEEIFYPEYPDLSKNAEQVFEMIYNEPLKEKKEEEKPKTTSAEKKTEKKEKKAEKKTEKKAPALVNTRSEEKKEETEKVETEQQVEGQTEIAKDFPQYCPDEMLNPPEEEKEETVISAQTVEDILVSADKEKILKMLKAEFAEPAAGWGNWLKKVVQIDD